MKSIFLLLLPILASANNDLTSVCIQDLKAMPGKFNEGRVQKACETVATLGDACKSVEGRPIYHYDKLSTKADPRNILVFSLVHGDELTAGSVARAWMERLTDIDPRNNWRIVPVQNPDGWRKKTRVNANGVDVNRNFPTKDWDDGALKYWETKTKKDPRRFPGHTANSEPETRCAVEHINAYKPDLILSIHNPYGVLDFDGPKISFPKYPHIPWKSLGNYPGSLGRYMWVDQSKPTLTIELHSHGVEKDLERFDRLQDITGDLAIQSEKKIQEEKNGKK